VAPGPRRRRRHRRAQRPGGGEDGGGGQGARHAQGRHAQAQGHRRGGALPGQRRVKVHLRPQPRRRRRRHHIQKPHRLVNQRDSAHCYMVEQLIRRKKIVDLRGAVVLQVHFIWLIDSSTKCCGFDHSEHCCCVSALYRYF
jgi:hypothetical protein